MAWCLLLVIERCKCLLENALREWTYFADSEETGDGFLLEEGGLWFALSSCQWKRALSYPCTTLEGYFA
jgi:hypothetical protein